MTMEERLQVHTMTGSYFIEIARDEYGSKKPHKDSYEAISALPPDAPATSWRKSDNIIGWANRVMGAAK